MHGGMCSAVQCSIASMPVVTKLLAQTRVVHFATIQHSGCFVSLLFHPRNREYGMHGFSLSWGCSTKEFDGHIGAMWCKVLISICPFPNSWNGIRPRFPTTPTSCHGRHGHRMQLFSVHIMLRGQRTTTLRPQRRDVRSNFGPGFPKPRLHEAFNPDSNPD